MDKLSRLLIAGAITLTIGAVTLAFPDRTPANPLRSCAEHLPWGVPNVSALVHIKPLCKPGFFVLQDEDNLGPRVAVEHLTAERAVGCTARADYAFYKDSEARSADPRSYAGSGYDRGHQVPAQDLAYSPTTMQASMATTNIWPQVPLLNREGWEGLEVYVRAVARVRGDLIVYTGPVLGNPPFFLSGAVDKIAVPVAFWKVVVDPKTNEAIAFLMPNAPVEKGPLGPHVRSVEAIENAAGIELPLPAGIDRTAVSGVWRASGKQLAVKACWTARR